MAIIGLLMLAIVVMALVMRGAPKPDYEDTPPALKSSAPPHPWSSGRPDDIDDFAGPGAPYGPGIDNEAAGPQKPD